MLWAAWQTDNRDYAEFLYEHADVYAAKLPKLERSTAAPKLVARTEPVLFHFDAAPTEDEDLERIRNYTIDSSGKQYKIYRGDTHRHTELSSGDGVNDGSLLQTYRYALDAASLDYLLVSELFDEIPDISFDCGAMSSLRVARATSITLAESALHHALVATAKTLV